MHSSLLPMAPYANDGHARTGSLAIPYIVANRLSLQSGVVVLMSGPFSGLIRCLGCGLDLRGSGTSEILRV